MGKRLVEQFLLENSVYRVYKLTIIPFIVRLWNHLYSIAWFCLEEKFFLRDFSARYNVFLPDIMFNLV